MLVVGRGGSLLLVDRMCRCVGNVFVLMIVMVRFFVMMVFMVVSV